MTVWQFAKKRWVHLTLFLVVTSALAFFVVPRLPPWLQAIAYGALVGHTCYNFGVLAERKRRIADYVKHGEDLDKLRDETKESLERMARQFGFSVSIAAPKANPDRELN